MKGATKKPLQIWNPGSGGTGGSSPNGVGGRPAATFSFAPSLIDGTTTLPEAATVTVTINGVETDVSESAGESYLQVANDLYNALVTAGLQNEIEDGQGDVMVAQDFSGQPLTQIYLTMSDLSGDPVDWIDTGVGT